MRQPAPLVRRGRRPSPVAGQRRLQRGNGVVPYGHAPFHRGGLDPRPQLGLDPRPSDEPAREALVAAARPVFEADVAKACHHGSADFTDLFLRAVNPLAVVVSSGDDEPYAHPRPDTLGALGKHGRGPRPLLFSPELARSTRESIKAPLALRGEINRLAQELAAAATADERARAQAALDAALTGLERSVAVYGLINLRTDGRRVVLAQKLERLRGRSREEWDVHCLEPDAAGTLRYVPEQ